MAMASALMPSPDLKSAFSPYTDSPSSPAPYSLAFRGMQRHSITASDSLAPPPSPYPATVDPSPVESINSTSTDATDIEMDGNQEDEDEDDAKSPEIQLLSPASPDVAMPHAVRLDTEIASRTQPSADDGPQSVIHAPKGFKGFANSLPTHHEDSPTTNEPIGHETKRSPPLTRRRSTSSPSAKSENTVTSTDGNGGWETGAQGQAIKETAVINTQVPPARHGAGSTPRASTQEEAEAEWRKRRSRHSRNLSGSSGSDNANNYDDDADAEVQSIGAALRTIGSAEQDITSLKGALDECWKLCNTLATLSSSHRERMFSFGGTGEMQEQAWKSCWKLCKQLYESREQDHATQVKPTLELCRDFCQALFEARVRGDEITDSILRVSFELNNHLYNTHDRSLPDIFTERTLDFYLTMCHRLMKQRTALPEETDSLLRACWTLAELLFSLRENNRDNKPIDEEMLGSAVQACWDLCDLFRGGWTAMRPERTTPRPGQRPFAPSGYAGSASGNFSPPPPGYSRESSVYAASSGYGASRGYSRPPSSLSLVEQNLPSVQDRRLRQQFVPETPTTIFDEGDGMASPGEPPMPNILVLGPEHPAMQSRQSMWPSSASNSGYSEVSRTTTSSRTAQGQAQTPRAIESSQTSPKSVVSSTDPSGEDPHLVRIKALVLKAAQNKGYPRNSPNPPSLPSYVKTLPNTSFGQLPWQVSLFESYRKLVLSDPTLRDTAGLPIGRRLTAHEIAKAVLWISKKDAYQWLYSLYSWVFGFTPEESGMNKSAGLQV